jgi:hypothetical protein
VRHLLQSIPGVLYREKPPSGGFFVYGALFSFGGCMSKTRLLTLCAFACCAVG